MNASETAIVCIEFQNEFCTTGGKLHDVVKDTMASNNMLANAAETVTKARDLGILVVHVPIMYADSYPELPKDSLYGILKGVKEGEAFQKGSWNVEFCDAMKPAAGEVVVEGKRGLCAFASTNLDFILRQNGIKNVALAGFLTNCCVESTMRTAYEKGYNVLTLTDCCGGSMDGHKAAIEHTFPMFSHPVTHSEFLGKLAA